MRLAGIVLTAAVCVLAIALIIVIAPAIAGRHPAPAIPPASSVPAAPQPSPVPFTGSLPVYP